MGNVHMEAAQINYRGGEKKMSVEEAIKTASDEIDTLRSGLNDKAVMPLSSATKLATMSGGSSQNFTVSDSGYLSICVGTGDSQSAFSALVRDEAFERYGVYTNATIPPYSSETIGGLYVKKGRTYNVRNIGETDIDVYLCV